MASATMLPLLFAIAGTAVDYFGVATVSMMRCRSVAVAGVPLVAWGYGGDAVNCWPWPPWRPPGFSPTMTARDSITPGPPLGQAGRVDRINGPYRRSSTWPLLSAAIGGGDSRDGGITTMWITATAFGLSIARLPPCNSRCRQAAPHLAAPGYPGSPRGCACGHPRG